MIYEVRTYVLTPESVPEFEENFASSLPHREKYSKLAAFWHTEVGPLNQVIHVWPYDSPEERIRIRAEASNDPHWPPPNDPDIFVSMASEIFIPAPFMRPMGGGQKLGNIYEMRTYTLKTGTLPEILKRWGASVPHREKYSPMAAAMYTELDGLNKWVHIWPYKDMQERDQIRAEALESPYWPPGTGKLLVSMENKIMVPSSFSPMR